MSSITDILSCVKITNKGYWHRIEVPCSFALLGILSLGQGTFGIQEVLPFEPSETYPSKELTSAK